MEAVRVDQSSARERGRAHGELWRREIEELADIRTALTQVGLTQRYNAHDVSAQSENQKVEAVANQTSGLKTVFAVVFSVVGKDLRIAPAKAMNGLKSDPVLRKVLPGLFIVPFKIHGLTPQDVAVRSRSYRKAQGQAKLYVPVDKPWWPQPEGSAS